MPYYHPDEVPLVSEAFAYVETYLTWLRTYVNQPIFITEVCKIPIPLFYWFSALNASLLRRRCGRATQAATCAERTTTRTLSRVLKGTGGLSPATAKYSRRLVFFDHLAFFQRRQLTRPLFSTKSAGSFTRSATISSPCVSCSWARHHPCATGLWLHDHRWDTENIRLLSAELLT